MHNDEFHSIKKVLRQPHICCMFAEMPIWDGYRPIENPTFSRTLNIDNPSKRISYSEIKPLRAAGSLLRTHWMQRNLLLTHFEFLTRFADSKHPVLHIGAAPAGHIAYLAKLFPNQAFILYDPCDFTVTESSQIKIYQKFFTDADVAHFEKEEVLFISEIYDKPSKIIDSSGNVSMHSEWMDLQARWHRRLNTTKSLMDFHLPYPPGHVTYLNGDLYIQPFGRRDIRGTRLLVSEGERVYDYSAYDEAGIYFNLIDRLQCYDHPYQNENLDACYYCHLEAEVLKSYLLKYVDPALAQNQEKLRAAIQTLSGDISDFLSTFLAQKRTLRTNFVLPEYNLEKL